jgi:hypothetical protein
MRTRFSLKHQLTKSRFFADHLRNIRVEVWGEMLNEMRNFWLEDKETTLEISYCKKVNGSNTLRLSPCSKSSSTISRDVQSPIETPTANKSTLYFFCHCITDGLVSKSSRQKSPRASLCEYLSTGPLEEAQPRSLHAVKLSPSDDPPLHATPIL